MRCDEIHWMIPAVIFSQEEGTNGRSTLTGKSRVHRYHQIGGPSMQPEPTAFQHLVDVHPPNYCVSDEAQVPLVKTVDPNNKCSVYHAPLIPKLSSIPCKLRIYHRPSAERIKQPRLNDQEKNPSVGQTTLKFCSKLVLLEYGAAGIL